MTVAGHPGQEWGSHLLLLYRDEGDRRASVVSWVQQGLERGEKVLFSTVPGETEPEPEPELEQGGVDVAEAVRAGQFAFVPMEEFFSVAGQAALVRRALDEGFPGVRLAAQANAAVGYLGEAEYQAVDHLIDELCLSLPVSALCQYHAGRSNGTALTTVVDSHLEAVEDAAMRLRRHGDVVLVAGEVDRGSAEVLAYALQRICQRQATSRVDIDLSELRFIDVGGCRAVVAGTETLRRDGGTVFLRGASGHIRKVMCLLAMNRLPGVELV